MRAKGRSRSHPNRSSGPQPSAAATAQNGLSRNRPTSSTNRSQRLGGTSPGGDQDRAGQNPRPRRAGYCRHARRSRRLGLAPLPPKTLILSESTQRRGGEHLRCQSRLRAAEILGSHEGAHVSIFPEHLRRFCPKALIEAGHLSIFDGSRRNPRVLLRCVSKALTFFVLSIFGGRRQRCHQIRFHRSRRCDQIRRYRSPPGADHQPLASALDPGTQSR